ncbi:cucumber peeling cupredoxin-like [Malania oleifera]|uniref:cucumber peeling cupredoxin-like n=1 Tax=Malania oleifera TaxID=397392 RepID=UPI0025ADCED7|nr:cucumber peeling cupredoxin-like [Malania oleifera]
MDRRVGLICCFMVAAAAMQSRIAAADTHVVGDSSGWTVPQEGATAYSDWAAKVDFKVGDTLVFNWTGTHDVAEVSNSTAYANCSKTSTINSVLSTSPVNINLTSNGTRYFICTVGQHCERGQKVTVSIKSSESASSTIVSASFAVLLSMAISILSYM